MRYSVYYWNEGRHHYVKWFDSREEAQSFVDRIGGTHAKIREHVAPTPFGVERAQQIWDARGLQNELIFTPGEAEYVKQVWYSLKGTATMQDAFFHIFRGERESDHIQSQAQVDERG